MKNWVCDFSWYCSCWDKPSSLVRYPTLGCSCWDKLYEQHLDGLEWVGLDCLHWWIVDPWQPRSRTRHHPSSFFRNRLTASDTPHVLRNHRCSVAHAKVFWKLVWTDFSLNKLEQKWLRMSTDVSPAAPRRCEPLCQQGRWDKPSGPGPCKPCKD